MRLLRSLSIAYLVAAVCIPQVAQAEFEARWQSSVLANLRFPFPYESGEIREASDGLYRLDEKFEREVAPMGPVSPQAANFWRACVISRFASKQGFSGWAFADGPEAKFEAKASTMYFVLANTAEEVPEKYRQSFSPTANFERLCGQFLKPEYYWWK